jgi:hypothetical protein
MSTVDPWEKIRPHVIRAHSAAEPGEAVVWERDDDRGGKTEVSVSPYNGGYVRAAHVGPRGGTETFLSGKPDKVRRVLQEQRKVLYQVEKALELLGAGKWPA